MRRWSNPSHLPWRWILSALHVLLAATLLIAGHIESSKHEAQFKPRLTNEGWQLRTEWDYVPRAYELMIIVDFPVVLASAPITAVTKSKLVPRAFFVALVGFFWYWIGRCIEQNRSEPETPHKLPAKFSLAANVIGFMVSGALLVSILWSGSGATALVVYMAILGWCAGFVAYFTVKLVRRWQVRAN